VPLSRDAEGSGLPTNKEPGTSSPAKRSGGLFDLCGGPAQPPHAGATGPCHAASEHAAGRRLSANARASRRPHGGKEPCHAASPRVGDTCPPPTATRRSTRRRRQDTCRRTLRRHPHRHCARAPATASRPAVAPRALRVTAAAAVNGGVRGGVRAAIPANTPAVPSPRGGTFVSGLAGAAHTELVSCHVRWDNGRAGATGRAARGRRLESGRGCGGPLGRGCGHRCRGGRVCRVYGASAFVRCCTRVRGSGWWWQSCRLVAHGATSERCSEEPGGGGGERPPTRGVARFQAADRTVGPRTSIG